MAVGGIGIRNSALMQLQDCGYRVLVTQLTPDSVPIHDIDFTQPTAFILGNEVDGAPCNCSDLGACPSRRQLLPTKWACRLLHDPCPGSIASSPLPYQDMKDMIFRLKEG